ncbi:MAG: fimbrial assembly protein FimA [Pseudorhodobacter sp. PARRP1]|nr:MAG: fimbrial assembly protein FimA [Pseudorhodobacter sp. PARRP1]
MTFSLIARCAKTGQFGMVISSSSPAVAARCAHTRAGVGAVASQNITDPALGPLLLNALAQGKPADQALASVTKDRQHIDYRQLLVIDAQGATAIHSGAQVLGIWGEAQGVDCAAGGNLLANPSIPTAMITAFEAATGHLGDRLIAALTAGQAAGGEAGPVHSAGLKIADKLDWPLVDLRIDWSDSPIQDLATAWEIYRPQMAAYVQRAQDPTQAPSYGVPGDA